MQSSRSWSKPTSLLGDFDFTTSLASTITQNYSALPGFAFHVFFHPYNYIENRKSNLVSIISLKPFATQTCYIFIIRVVQRMPNNFFPVFVDR